MTLERDRRISIYTLQAVKRLRYMQVQKVGEEEGLCQKGHTGPGRVKETD
uniref:Uncharacterized protein n=1 Tax=Lepeophtheirus salmonis TaxID=72036 RepID=A0A0K2TRN4_LEPSM